MSREQAPLPRRLLIATGSAHKFAELRTLLELSDTELVSLADLGLRDDAPEEGQKFADNALFKAQWYARRSGLPTLADDSGLEVDALDGQPGVRTRRFAGNDASDEQNNAHLLRLLDGVPPQRRTARYRCVLALVEPIRWLEVLRDLLARRRRSGPAVWVEATFEGRIALDPRGSGGFGYDPIFEPDFEPVGGLTVGQVSSAEKNAVSHRGKAARAMREVLVARGYR